MSPGGDLPPRYEAGLFAVALAVVQAPMAAIFVYVDGRARAAWIWAIGMVLCLLTAKFVGVFAIFVWFAACVVLGTSGATRRPGAQAARQAGCSE